MCASCVAQGITYVGGSAAFLRLMAFRAKRRRVSHEAGDEKPLRQDERVGAAN